MMHVIEIIEVLNARGVVLRSLRESIDFSTPTGKMMAAVFATMAEYERGLIKERAAAARRSSIGARQADRAS